MSQSENTFQLTIDAGKLKELREKGVKLYGTVKKFVRENSEATRTLIKMPYSLEADVNLEDLKYVLEGLSVADRMKVMAWASVKATDPQVQKYSRVRTGGTVGAVAIVTGALYYYCS